MAQDEGCFGRISRPRRCWAPPGIRPHLPSQFVREYVYVYSAVAPAPGKMTSLILPAADTAMMTLFLSHVSRTFSKYFIVMQVDRAGWHHSDELVIPATIRLVEQPAYSRCQSILWNISGTTYGKNTWGIGPSLPLTP